MTTLQEALDKEYEIYQFGRSGPSLHEDQPPFTAVAVFIPATDSYKIRISCPIATFKSNVQPSFEPSTSDELREYIARIEAYTSDEMINFVSQFVPTENRPIMP
jgi:hypothetical protein